MFAIFETCTDQFLTDLAMTAEMILYVPGQTICHTGEVAHNLYVIFEGSVNRSGEEGHLQVGDCFEESLVLAKNKYETDYKSKGFTKVFLLKRDHIVNIWNQNNDQQIK